MSKSRTGLLAVIPARARSEGLPGKNIKSFAGLPLIAHTILFSKLCPEIERCVVSTDSLEIAAVADRYGGDVPFLRPPELACDDTPLWLAVRHALTEMERRTGLRYEHLLLLDPTSPARDPADIAASFRRLRAVPKADGIVGVSRPYFNPLWVSVIDQNGWMADLHEGASRFQSRQRVPPVYRINGSLYIWKADFVRKPRKTWRKNGKYIMYEIPERMAMSIDTAEEFELAELLVTSGKIVFPWMNRVVLGRSVRRTQARLPPRRLKVSIQT